MKTMIIMSSQILTKPKDAVIVKLSHDVLTEINEFAIFYS